MRIYVAEFAAVNPNEGSVGGFEWRHDWESLSQFVKTGVQSDYDVEVMIGWLETPPGLVGTSDPKDLRPSERRVITEWVEGVVHHPSGIPEKFQRLVVHAAAGPEAEADRVFAAVRGVVWP